MQKFLVAITLSWTLHVTFDDGGVFSSPTSQQITGFSNKEACENGSHAFMRYVDPSTTNSFWNRTGWMMRPGYFVICVPVE